MGVLTPKGAMRAALYSPAVDHAGSLRVGTAVGISGDAAARAATLLDAGADVLVMDLSLIHI